MDMKNMTKLNDVISLIWYIPQILVVKLEFIIDNLPLCYLQNAKTCLPCCRVETLNNEEAQGLLPGVLLPFNTAFFMPEALNINPRHYLEVCMTNFKFFCSVNSFLSFSFSRLPLTFIHFDNTIRNFFEHVRI
jgi:hypothetical protein